MLTRARPPSGSVGTPPTVRRVLVVDDSRIFADLLADRIRSAGFAAVDVASSLDEARAALRRGHPQLVLLDLQVGREDGLDLLEDVGGLLEPARVLVVSGSDDPAAIVRGLRAGAAGWVLKTETVTTLIDACDTVLRGDTYLAPSAVGPVVRMLLAQERVEDNFVSQLSGRQLEVLQCVVAGMSRAECAERLHLSVNTVRTHVQALLRRADVHSALALASAARDLGVTAIDMDEKHVAGRRPGSGSRSPR